MSEVKHAPGKFCWVELMTPDVAAAKTFYSGLLGWQTHDDEIPGGGTYTMGMVAGGNVCGMYQLNDEMKQQGVPPHWQVYISVDDADKAVARAKELGATIALEPMDVMEFGRMASVKDPTGAIFSIWQPRLHHGFGHGEPKPGTVCWNELATTDVDEAGAFYGELFGWQPHVHQMPHMQYTEFKSGDQARGGMMPMQGDEWKGIPPHWMTYFAVEDTATSVKKAEQLGGKIHVPPTVIPNVGTFSVIKDPTGAVCSILDQQTGASK